MFCLAFQLIIYKIMWTVYFYIFLTFKVVDTISYYIFINTWPKIEIDQFLAFYVRILSFRVSMHKIMWNVFVQQTLYRNNHYEPIGHQPNETIRYNIDIIILG